jgi:hypothetical protein
MEVISEPMTEAPSTEQQRSAGQNGAGAAVNGARPATESRNLSATHKESSHMSNERLLAAGGTIAGAAFLGGAFGGPLGAAFGAVAGLGVAVFSAKAKLKEGARRS